MKIKILLILVALLVLPGLLLAGTTGKIKGKVTLKETGEPAIGANVIIDGTHIGVITDIGGEYVILNVPAGFYTLKASFVGYHVPPISNVKVIADLTTEINFELVREDIQLQAVQIVAERPLINKNATNATRVLTTDDIQALPVRGLTGVFALQPGVILQDNNIYIRGGREDEVGYYVEGASARDILTGRNAVTVIPEAIEEFQVQAGGYNAEYGGANAGIIRQQLRSGGAKFKATYSYESDKLNSLNSNSFLNTYSYGFYNHTLTLSGPLYEDKIKLFVAGENQFLRDRNASFWDGFQFPNADFPQPLINGPGGGKPGDTLLAGGGVPSYSGTRYGALIIPNGDIPSNSMNRWSGSGTLTFDYNPIIVRLASTISWQRQQINALPVQSILNTARLPLDDNSTGLYNLKFTHLVNPKTFYEINLNYFDSRRKRYDPALEDNLMAYGDSIEASKHGFTFFSYANALLGLSPPDARYDGFPYSPYGQLIVGGQGSIPANIPSNYIKSKQTYMGGSIDATTQYDVHEFKIGGSYQRYTVRLYSVGRFENTFLQYYAQPDSGRDPAARVRLMRSQGIPNNFGYDVFGQEIDNGFDGPKHPTFASFYLQDKLEYKDLIINGGVRFDYLNTDDKEFLNPANPQFLNGDIFSLDPAGLRQKDAFKAVSPRLGLSFPVTDRTVFHMQYGKFIQSPQLNDIYLGTPQLALYVSGRNYIPTPVGLGLDPERTTQYEMGFSQQISDFASFDATGFYKDIKGQIQTGQIITQTGSLAKAYIVLQNGDFATTKGLEFTFTLRRVNRLQAKLNYTLSDAQGTGSHPNGAIGSVNNGTPVPTIVTPLTFNQTHRGTINLDYHFAQGDGGPILERLGANILFTFNSGHNFTKVTGGLGQTGPEDGGILFDGDPRNRRPVEPLNASTTPWNFSLDLRVDKSLNVSSLFDMNFYIYVENLLNTKNVINVFGRTGNADDDGFLTNADLSGSIINKPDNGPAYVQMYRDANLGLRQNYWRNQGGDLFGTPRQIRFGLRLEY